MKILVIGNRDRYGKFTPDELEKRREALVFCKRGAADGELLAAGGDAGIILADAIAPVGRDLIEKMPNLRMIHSEGVAYDKIDLRAAAERGVFVCNNKGCNAAAVAEQAILLMLAFLRRAIAGDREVRAGRQIQMKERLMVEGITELGGCTAGLIGFGDIAKATAVRLGAFGCRILYYTPRQKPRETEEEFAVRYAALEELAALSDIVSIHASVTPETTGMIGAGFLGRMKPSAFVVNTARGEIVDNLALREAIVAGKIAGAAFDTLYPEPVPADHPLLGLPGSCRDRVIFAPHLGGITTGSFMRAHRNIWQNVGRIERGEKPVNIVNFG
ncbi:MAG: 2-hydroxyacid dehydrogenase [Treponema sp.]|jgi:phosphoglycerate dehydrogenase-like enzyme|nr:2-hydroxyacid dehydrogenase [Treponema sp.]